MHDYVKMICGHFPPGFKNVAGFFKSLKFGGIGRV
jgi:hypothetical protein